jgi:hypothetical protein
MRYDVSTKTITEVEQDSGLFNIHCFSDMNDDGTTTPSIYKSQILEKKMIVDNVSGKEGELMLSHVGDSVGELNKDGELTLRPQNDDAQKYDKEDENLIYNEG